MSAIALKTVDRDTRISREAVRMAIATVFGEVAGSAAAIPDVLPSARDVAPAAGKPVKKASKKK